jgi:hypothetical protein
MPKILFSYSHVLSRGSRAGVTSQNDENMRITCKASHIVNESTKKKL